MELNKHEFEAVLGAYTEINEWATNRLDSMLGRQTRWPLIVEVNDFSGDMEFTWIDRDGDTQDFSCTFEALADESDDTWRAEYEAKENLRRSVLQERKRREALTELDRAKRAYLEASEKAREVGALREVDTSKML